MFLLIINGEPLTFIRYIVSFRRIWCLSEKNSVVKHSWIVLELLWHHNENFIVWELTSMASLDSFSTTLCLCACLCVYIKHIILYMFLSASNLIIPESQVTSFSHKIRLHQTASPTVGGRMWIIFKGILFSKLSHYFNYHSEVWCQSVCKMQ